MDSGSALTQLDRCPPVARLSLEARRRLAEISREVTYASQERIASLVRPLRDILIVLEGRAKLVAVTEDGVERILYVYRPCDVIGSRILLEESAEAGFEVVAMNDVQALAIPKTGFLAIAKEHPELLESITRVLLGRVDRLMSWMMAAMSDDASDRLSKLLLDFAKNEAPEPEEFVPLEYPLTHETMAQIIGASRPHTTTLLRELEREGAVRRIKPRGLLVCPARLEDRLRMTVNGAQPL